MVRRAFRRAAFRAGGGLGRRQAVRQRILIPSYGGSNPPAPAKPFYRIYINSLANCCNGRRTGRAGVEKPHNLGGLQLEEPHTSADRCSRTVLATVGRIRLIKRAQCYLNAVRTTRNVRNTQIGQATIASCSAHLRPY